MVGGKLRRMSVRSAGSATVNVAAVIGVPDPHWGEKVVTVVVPAAGRVPDEADLVAFCRARLAGYETPKRVELVEAFPETVGAKILEYKLRERFAATAG